MTDAQAPTVPGRGTDRASRADSVLRVLAVVGFAFSILAGAAFLTGVVTMPAEVVEALNSPVAASLIVVGMTALALAGMVLARQQPRSTIAWLMLATALAWVVSSAALVAAWFLLEAESPAAAFAGWVTNWVWVPAHALSLVMLMRFPTGRLPAPRWRIAEGVVIGWAAATTAVTALLPGPLGAEILVPLVNPIGWDAVGDIADALLTALFTVLPVLVLVAASAPVMRWRRAGTRERAALRWIAVAAIILAVAAPLALLGTAGEVLQGLAFLLLPIAIGTAVLREQLWDLDLRRRYDRLRLAREQERERLRHELHDSLGPVLGSISMRAEAARNLLSRGDTARIDELLASIGGATEHALDEIRRLIDDLGPTALHDRDLVPALHEHFAAYADRFPVSLTARPDPLPPLDERAAATAYLIVSEAVRNAARHSGGTHAYVSLQVVGDRLRGDIRDDGRGLSGASAGIGRAGMARRIGEEGGRLRIEDASGGGTLVAFELPGARR